MVSKTTSRGCTKGFTLIELLVVIAIIAILAAILFPVFAQAREQARKTSCLSNIKQVNTATQMYLQDFDETVPLNFKQDKNTAQYWFTWQDFVQPYAKNYNFLICPDNPANKTDPVNFLDYAMSYGMLPTADSMGTGFSNWLTRSGGWYTASGFTGGLTYDGMSGFGYDPNNNDHGLGFCKDSKDHPSKPLAGVARPAEYVFIFESGNWDGFHGVYGQQQAMGYCGGWVGYPYSYFGPVARHSGGFNQCHTDSDSAVTDPQNRRNATKMGIANISFLDGHVKGMRFTDLARENPTAKGTLLYWSPNE